MKHVGTLTGILLVVIGILPLRQFKLYSSHANLLLAYDRNLVEYKAPLIAPISILNGVKLQSKLQLYHFRSLAIPYCADGRDLPSDITEVPMKPARSSSL